MNLSELNNYKICQQCGKLFYTKNKKRKFCSYSCSKAAKFKKYSSTITNDEFKKLYKKYFTIIRKVLYARALRNFDLTQQNVLIALWIAAIRYKEKGNKNLDKIPYSYVVRTIIGAIQRTNSNDNIGVRKLTKLAGEDVSLDSILGDDSDITILDTIEDNKHIDIDKQLDLKNLVTKIIYEGIRDKDSMYAIIQAEEKENNYKETSYQDIINNYGIKINPKLFMKRALIGKKRLYSLYSDEILDTLNITEKELGFTPDKKDYQYPRECVVCGRLFIPTRNDVRWNTCSFECSKILSNSKRNEQARIRKKEQMLREIEDLRKEKQKLKIEINNKKQQVCYYQNKLNGQTGAK